MPQLWKSHFFVKKKHILKKKHLLNKKHLKKSMVSTIILHFTAPTINCVCHSIRSMFIVLEINNFDAGEIKRSRNSDLKKYGTKKIQRITILRACY